MADEVKLVPVKLPNGAEIRIQARSLGGREQVGIRDFPFTDIIPSIEGIAETVLTAIKKVGPKKATIEFGVEASIESGKLVALLCNGEATANLKITLEWEPGK